MEKYKKAKEILKRILLRLIENLLIKEIIETSKNSDINHLIETITEILKNII